MKATPLLCKGWLFSFYLSSFWSIHFFIAKKSLY